MAGWRSKGNCVKADPDIFFSGYERDIRKARAYCSTCPVSSKCFEIGMTTFLSVDGESKDLPEGIWGGFTYEERKRINNG